MKFSEDVVDIINIESKVNDIGEIYSCTLTEWLKTKEDATIVGSPVVKIEDDLIQEV